MVRHPIKQALIIAAGNGSRLKRGEGDTTPKPLRKLLGMPLIERIILSAKKAGVEAFTVVVGYQGEQLKNFLLSRDFGVSISVVENPDWRKKNGVSVLKARESMGRDPFLLLMADHIFDPQALLACLENGVPKNSVSLAVDYRVTEIDDLDDATKVVCDRKTGTISRIGKTLETYNAIDTGIFCATPALFDVLEKIEKETGDCSLSEGMQIFGAAQQLFAFEFPPNTYWQDVDTPAAWKIAEKKLLRSCIKPTDGVISRNFNRHISLFFTRYLMRTGFSANTVTGFVTLVGTLSGSVVAKGGYWGFLIGALLFKLASILDGCDGEMSRLRFTNSKIGQWLDTGSDNLTYLFFVVGVMAAYYRAHPSTNSLYLIGFAFLGFAMLLSFLFTYLLKYTKSGSLVAVQTDLEKNTPSEDQGWAEGLIRRLGFMIKRDFFALVFLAAALIGKGEWIFYLIMGGTHIAWITLFNIRRSLFEVPTASVANETV